MVGRGACLYVNEEGRRSMQGVVGGKSKKIIIYALRGGGWMGVHVKWNDSKLRVRAGVQGWFNVFVACKWQEKRHGQPFP